MKVTFYNHYCAPAEQTLRIVPAGTTSQEWPSAGAVTMTRLDNGVWRLETELPPGVNTLLYRYELDATPGGKRQEPQALTRRITLDPAQTAYHVFDCWQDTPPDITLYTSAFTQVVFAHEPSTATFDATQRLVLHVRNPRVAKGWRMAITGDCEALGEWCPAAAVPMSCCRPGEWEVRLNADAMTFPTEYKFIVMDDAGKVEWETGENRRIEYLPDELSTVIVNTYPFRQPSPLWKGAGTVVPLFALRSKRSFGAGDLSDLRMLVDWAEKTGQCLIQLLPLNDTTRTHTWRDSYPYSAISVYAIHPMYIAIDELGVSPDDGERATLNALPEVDYEAVVRGKLHYCRTAFDRDGMKTLASDAFRTFFAATREWLVPYTAFCFYRDRYGTADFMQWGEHAAYCPEREQALCREDGEAWQEIAFTYFLQFVAHRQFAATAAYARSKGVILKGDLPIGVHRTSVETWTEPAFFSQEGQAGAPPDVFSETGQNWSFPTYNWEAMQQDGFAWWKRRLRFLGTSFASLRIDHILGFFRIWEIPLSRVDGLCGHFRPALPMSTEEIADFGLRFRDEYTRPRIHTRYLPELFGNTVEVAKAKYLVPVDDLHWTLQPCADTQRKIEALPVYGAVTEQLRAGLMRVSNEMLFLPDPCKTGKYHPRIAAAKSYAYRELTTDEQAAFDRLSQYFFHERHNMYWRDVALSRLTPLTACTDMLVCGEDLGMIPESVHEVMSRLHILSLELERAPKTTGREFADLQELPCESVCTTSTHDMSPLRLWWMEDAARTQRYFQSVLQCDGDAPAECTPEIAGQILIRHLRASSMLTIVPLQDWLALSASLRRPNPADERINIPADPHHYWRYRMHITIETLLEADDFNAVLRKMIAASGR